jgi:two-component system, cell cycle sensor histidine kinase and response regulator CckA
MDELFILGISNISQGAAILLAMRLIPFPHRARVWVLLSAAMVLMTAHPGFTFAGHMDKPESFFQARILPQFLSLFISILMQIGILTITSIFKRRRQKEEPPQEIEVRFRTLFETLPIGISITDKNGNIVYVNQVSEKLLGISRAEHTLRNLDSLSWNIIQPDGSPMPAEQFPAAIALTQSRLVETVEMGVQKKEGGIIWLNVTATPLPIEKLGTLITYMDITPLKKVQEKLRKSEEQFKDLFEHSKDLICSQDLTGKLISMNPESSRVLGYEAKELVGMMMQDLMPPELRDTVDKFLKEIQRTGVAKGIVTVLSRYGERRLWEYTGLLKDRGTEEPIIHGFARDITEKWQAQKALKKSEEQYRKLAETAQDFIITVDLTGKPSYVNPAALAASEYTLEEALEMNIADILPKEHLSRMVEMLTRRIAGDDQHWAYEIEFISKSGKRVPVEINSTILKEKDKPSGILIIARDISFRKEAEEQRRKMEDQLRHVQKLESLGVLAGGIAHDFNNLLMGILGNADLALMELSPASPARSNIQEIEKASRRAAELCRQMLAYSGKGKFIVEKLSLSEVVKEMTHMLEVSISKKAALRYHFEKNLPAVKADATQIRQVIMNLITNASEAIGEASGVIAVTTGVIQCNREYLAGTYLDDHLPEGLYVYLDVADTGCGMDEATRNRIFDPFFTTKFTGRGLGLAAILGIVRGHWGAIRVYSEPGKGSTFRVLFPAVPGEPEDQEKKIREEKQSWQGNGLVLLVDDDGTVRQVGEQMLERLGFEVISAADGQEALECFRRRADQIRCVLLDLTMPHLDGEECFRELRGIRKDVRVVVTSGYNEQEVTQRFTGKGLAGFVQKPFTLNTLRKTLRSVLEGPLPI